jgi:hypothetical protein
MKLISGPAVADLCDYSFGDQAGMVGGVYGAFMNDANSSNTDFLCDKEVIKLFIDNIRLYHRPIKCGNKKDQVWINGLQKRNDLMKLCAHYPEKKFIIFCNNEDTPINSDIDIPDNVLGIFAANAVGFKDKLYPFPYGVGRKLSANDERQSILHAAMEKDPKPKKLLYINHAEHTNISARGNIREIFSKLHYATVGEAVNYHTYVREIQNHKFMICPQGNAVDCHRNWEVLYLKRVPIMVKNDYLQELYKNYPVLWVDDFGKITKSVLSNAQDLCDKARNIDTNLLDLYSVFNRAVKRAKDS